MKALKDRWKANKFCSHWDSKEGKKCKAPSSFWTHDISPVSDRTMKLSLISPSCPELAVTLQVEQKKQKRSQTSVRRGSTFCEIADPKYWLPNLFSPYPYAAMGSPYENILEGGPEGNQLRIKANSLPGLMISSSSLKVTLEFFRFRFGLWMSRFPSSMVSVEILLLWAVLNSVRF